MILLNGQPVWSNPQVVTGVDGALSGVPKVVQIKDFATGSAYYTKIYPTKT
jgi:hypothetical protein